jgi:hypothetical protein
VLKKAVLVILVVVIILVGLPFAMEMSDMAPCASCAEGDVTRVVSMCLAIMSVFVLVALSTSTPVIARLLFPLQSLFADPLERPPQLA